MVQKNKETAAARTDVQFNRAAKLPNESEGSRFLVMQRRVDREGDDHTMRKVNPIMLAKLIRGVGSVESMKLIHDGRLLIKAKTYKAANSIFQIKAVPGFDVMVAEYTQLNKSVGVIFDRSLTAASDEEILEELKPFNCKIVRRVMKTGKDGEKFATGTFFLTFSTLKLPKEITIGYNMHKMEPYVPNPTRCFKCQRFGHVSNSCRSNDKICVNCGEVEHTTKDEKCGNPPRCVNCKATSHNAMSRDCPEYMYRKKIEELKIHEEKSHVEATRLLEARDPTANPAKAAKKTYASAAGSGNTSCHCKWYHAATKPIDHDAQKDASANVQKENLKRLGTERIWSDEEESLKTPRPSNHFDRRATTTDHNYE